MMPVKRVVRFQGDVILSGDVGLAFQASLTVAEACKRGYNTFISIDIVLTSDEANEIQLPEKNRPCNDVQALITGSRDGPGTKTCEDFLHKGLRNVECEEYRLNFSALCSTIISRQIHL